MRPALLLPFLLAGPAVADSLPLPANCQAVVTLQLGFCTVSNIWNCEVDGRREVWTYNYGEGANIVFQRDTDGQQHAAFIVGDSGATTTTPTVSIADPVSIAALAATGSDSYDMTTRRPDGSELRATGTYRVMGEAISIDGWALVPVISANDYGNGQSQGFYNLMDASRGILFHVGRVADTGAEAQVPEQFLPVEVAFDGDAGFRAAEPTIGCGG